MQNADSKDREERHRIQWERVHGEKQWYVILFPLLWQYFGFTFWGSHHSSNVKTLNFPCPTHTPQHCYFNRASAKQSQNWAWEWRKTLVEGEMMKKWGARVLDNCVLGPDVSFVPPLPPQISHNLKRLELVYGEWRGRRKNVCVCVCGCGCEGLWCVNMCVWFPWMISTHLWFDRFESISQRIVMLQRALTLCLVWKTLQYQWK